VASDTDRRDAKDIEVPAETAGEVKGGVRPPEGSAPARGIASPTGAKRTKHTKKTIHGPSGGMPHQ
jgi:hypothetical protein